MTQAFMTLLDTFCELPIAQQMMYALPVVLFAAAAIYFMVVGLMALALHLAHSFDIDSECEYYDPEWMDLESWERSNDR